MKLILRRTLISLLLLTGIATCAQAQAFGPGDLVFTGVNIFDDDISGSVQNDAFSFVLLRDCPKNTIIYFTDLGWMGSRFQTISTDSSTGPKTDGILQWSPGGNNKMDAGTRVTIFCKYSPTASAGVLTLSTPTANTALQANKEYISLGFAGDQLFAFTGNINNPTIIAGINVNRKTWETSLDAEEFTSSKSLKPATTSVLSFPSINAVNARYNCITTIGTSARLRNLVVDTTNWTKDYSLTVPAPTAFSLVSAPPCSFTVVNPDTSGIVYVNKQVSQSGDGSSWATALQELTTALNAAADPLNGITTIWVAQNTYKPDYTRNTSATFNIPSGVAVYGGFAGTETKLADRNIPANPVILSGDVDFNDVLTNTITLKATDIRGSNSTHLVTVAGNSAESILDGMIITGGAGNVSGGGGIYAPFSNLTIRNTQFYGNNTTQNGGAIYQVGGNIKLVNCVFFGNKATLDGTAIRTTGNTTLTNVTVGGNSGGGAAISSTGGIFTSYNSIVAKNTPGSGSDYSGPLANIRYSILGNLYYSDAATVQPVPDVVFNDLTNGNLRLTAANFGINKGDPQTNNAGYAAQADTLDLDRKTRISNSLIDLGAYEIQAIPQTITFPAFPSTPVITYGDTDIDPNATTSGDGTITYTSGNTAVADVVNGKIKTTGAGTAVITAHAGATNTYLPASPVSQTITVAKKALTIKAADVSRPYKTANPAATFTYTGFVYADDASVITGTVNTTFAANLNSPVGAYAITTDVSAASAANYSLLAANGTLTITQQPQTITFPAITGIVYGTAPITLPLNTDAGNAIVYTVVSGPATVSGNTLTITGAGDVTINADQPGSTNYAAAAQVTQTFNVAKAILTVTANDKNRAYKQANPTLEYTVTGLVNGDNGSVVNGDADISTTADIDSHTGNYPITVSAGTLTAVNYQFSFAPGTLTVTKASQVITLTALTDKTYGDAPFALNATSTSGLTVDFSVAGPATLSGNTVTITGTGNVTVTATQSGDTNYDAATIVSGGFTVLKKSLFVTADNKQRLYGGNNPALTYTYSGLVNGEDNSVVTGTPLLSTTADASSVPGGYPIQVTNAASLSAVNYNIIPASGILTVTIAPQTITFPAITGKTYGSAPVTLNTNSDAGLPITYNVVSGPATVNGNILTFTGAGDVTVSADQGGNGNYSPAPQSTQTFNVAKAILTVTANDKNRAYKQANPTPDYTITGFVNGENNSVVNGDATITHTADINSVPGVYPITVTVGALSAANYDFSFVNGSLTITQASQTITFPAITGKTYGDAAFTLSASSDAGLTVAYAVTSGPATVSGNTVTITGVGNVTISATQTGDANYTAAAAASQSFQVTPAILTVTADDKQKVYGANNPALTYTISGFVNGENSSVISGTPALSTSADNSSVPAIYPITVDVTPLTAANYTFAAVSGNLTVGLAPQTITFPAITGKTYGDAAFALNASSSSALAVSYSVVSGPATINGNTVTITGAGNVTIAADQGGNGNYSPAPQSTQTFNVAKAILTVTANDKNRAYKQANPTPDYTITGFVNGENNSVVNGDATITHTADINSVPGVYPITVTAGTLAAANYDFSFVNGSLTITQASQTITFPAITGKTYGDAAFTLSAGSNAGLTVAYAVTSGPATVNGNIVTITGVGNVTINATQAGDANYTAAVAVSQSFQVTPATLTVTADDKQKVYGANNPALTYTISGFVNGENSSVISGTPALSTSADNSSVPATYPITVDVTPLTAANYTFAAVSGNLTVGLASQTITFPAITGKTYGDAAFALNASSSSALAVSYSVVSGPATISGNTVTITGVGNVTIAADQGGNGNYSPATQVTQTFNVAKAILTVTANDKNRAYKQANPTPDYTITGFVNGETINVVSGNAIIAHTADINSVPGVYPITVTAGALSAANYNFSFVNGSLTITQASQTITFPAITGKTYGDAAFTLNAGSDAGLTVAYAVTSGPATVNGNTVTITGVGNVTISATQAGDANYTAAAAVSQSFQVTPATLMVTADDKQKVYGANNPALTYTISGFVNGENNSVISGTPGLSTTANNSSAPGTYPIAVDITPLTATNYIFTSVNGILTVALTSQTITFPAITGKTYGDAPFALNASSSSALAVSYSVISGPATISGNTVTITGTGNVTIAADQAGNGNYSPAAQVTQTFNVAKAILTVTANDKNKAYKQANPTPDYTITGFVNNENINVVSGNAIIAHTADINSVPGVYPITVTAGALSAANYDFSFVNGSLTITQASQTITFPAITGKTYGDAAFTLSGSSDVGLTVAYAVTSGPATVNGNTVTITGVGNVTISATQAGDANYTAAAAVSQSFQVTPATLMVTADDKQKVYGANNPALTYTINGFVNGENSSVVTGVAALSTTANNSSAPGTYPIAVDVAPLTAANYIFTPVNGILTVALTSQTITFPAITGKTYGDAAFTLSAGSSSALAVSYSVVSGPATISGNTVTITGTGNVTIAADQGGNGNYSPATQVTQTFNVAKAILTVTANDKNKAYKQANPTPDYTITGFVNNETINVVSGNAIIAHTADANSVPGVYPITVTAGALAAANYNFSFVNGSLTITQASQTITFPAITGKTYGDAAFTLGASSDAGLTVAYTVTSGPATVNGNTVTITGVGNVTISATQAGDANYTAAAVVSQSFQVTPATLTVTADDKQKVYGANNPALTYTISGFVNGENSSVITGVAALSTTANNSSAPGTYPIAVDVTPLTATNYIFTPVNGILTVALTSQTITFPAITGKTYGDAAFALNASSSSALAISYSVISGPATISGNTVTITGAGNVTIAADQAGNGNYSPAAQVTQTFNVAKAMLSIKAKDEVRTYTGNGYTGGNGVDYTGFVNGDAATSLTGALAYAGTSQGAINAGTYIITPSGLTSNNYNISFTDGQLTIAKAQQQITFTTTGNKNQGDPDFILTATASSGLPVTFTSDNTASISINGNTAHVGAAGTANISASQPGNSNYEPAQTVTQTIVVTAWTAPVITAQGSTTFCESNTLTLQSSSTTTNEWYRNGIQIPGATGQSLTVNESGSYTVKAIYDNNFGVLSAAVIVTVNPLPVGNVRANGNTTISKGETITLTASGGHTYLWTPATGLNDPTTASPVARPAVTTNYQVTITGSSGCSVTKDITITVKEDYKLEATNILTPNGDGKNDLWVVKNIDMYPQNEVKIFDRSGRMVFHQRGYTNNWNGTVNGQRLAEGTYYYIIDLGGNTPKFKGFITIVNANY
ncbi:MULTISPECIES: MBG domain-containing protein [unclassified Chitinophaga]|uniref:MBG domain-containing protein n=1 Tax=unclassified Chitinophaga TaxID=2619133 RepID=UPI00301054A9